MLFHVSVPTLMSFMKYFNVPQRIMEQNYVMLNVMGIYVDPEV